MDRFDKVIVVSLCDKLTKEIAKTLAQCLGMMFCDAKDLVEYELIDRDSLKRFSSKEYLDDAERKVMKHIASFEGVCVAINHDYFVQHSDILKEKSVIVFLNLAKSYVKENSNPIDFIAYDKHTKNLQKLADVVLNVRKTDENFVCLKIIEKLGEML